MATTNLTSLKANALTNVVTTIISTANIVSSVVPKISSITYPSDDTAAIPAGGQTITLTGSGFNAGASVLIDGTYASVVTVVSSTTITFTAPAKAAGTYVLYVINTDGGTAISVPGISYSGTPTWSTASGSIATLYETTAISNTVTSTGDAPITYSLYSGTLPPGSSLNTSTGLISGTSQATASSTTYNFTIRASDAQNQDTDRAFSITINPDVVTWSTPASNETYNVSKDSAIANVAMSASSAAGGSITYTADTLPTGLSITGANITGTPTVVNSTSTTLTATSTTTRTATRTINWVVSVASDTYFKNVTLLLNGETTVTPFNSDASTNNFALTIAGDTKPNKFNPYTPGYYSNYFDGTGDYIQGAGSTGLQFGTGDFTVELFFYPTANPASFGCLFTTEVGTATNVAETFNITATGLTLNAANRNAFLISAGTLTLNTWQHIAATRSGTTLRLFLNGVLVGSATDSTNWTADGFATGLLPRSSTNTQITGFVSNLRVLKGTALYTSAFTPPTTALTAITNTQLLTCQSNTFKDNSTNNLTITKVGDTTISPIIPFTPNSSYSTYGSAYFDGTGDYLTVPDNTAIESFTDFTIEFWVYFNSVAGSQVIVDKGWNGSAFSPYLIFLSGGSLVAYASAGGGSWDVLSGSSFGTPSVNTWYHIALTRSGSSIRLFRDGVVITTVTNSSTLMNSTSALGIGGSPSAGANPFNGYISNLRIVKGTAVYTSAFTPPTSPLTAIANTSLLTLQYNGGVTNQDIIDNSSFNNTITRFGNASQGTFSPYSVTGWSNYFDGTGDYFTLADNTALQFGTGDFTVELWWYPTSLATDQAFLGSSTAGGYDFVWRTSTGLNIGRINTAWDNTFSFTPVVNTWYHVAYSRSGTSLKVFVNGSQVGSTATNSISYVPGSGGAVIGGSTTADRLLTGYISNFRLVKGTAVYTSNFTPPTTPLTPIANTSLLTCQSNRFIDNSINNFTLTRAGDVSVQAFGPFGSVPEAVPISYSNYFDGTGDYLSTVLGAPLSLFSLDSFTIEFWLYMPVLPSVLGYVFHTSYAGTATYCYVSSTGVIAFGSSTGGTRTQSNSALSINTWYHVAICRDSGTERMFINGVAQTQTAGQFTHNLGTLYFGTDSSQNYYTNFYLSNFRIVKFTGLYSSNFTVPTSPLTAIANTSLLTCQSTRMIDNSTNAFTITATGDTKPRPFNPFGYTAQSATSYTPSLHGGSVYLDGTGDYLSIGTTQLWTPSNNLTIEGWFNISTAGDRCIFSKDAGTSGSSRGLLIYITSTGAVSVFYSVTGSSEAFATSSTGLVVANQWYHLAVVKNGSSCAVYLNGVSIATFTAATIACPASPTNYIGIFNAVYPMLGYISDLRIINGTAVYTSNFVPPISPLTSYSTSNPSSLLLNFNNAGIVDQHSSNVLETVGNARLSTAVKKYNNASMYFDGSSVLKVTGTHLLTPTNFRFPMAGEIYTIEGWFYFVTLNSPRSHLIGCYGTAESGWTIDVDTSGNFFFASGGAGTTLTMQSPITTGTWIHLAFVNTGSIIDVYKNGVKNVSSQANYTPGISTIPLHIGRRGFSTGDLPSTVYIDDLRITKGYARYTANFTPPIALTTR